MEAKPTDSETKPVEQTSAGNELSEEQLADVSGGIWVQRVSAPTGAPLVSPIKVGLADPEGSSTTGFLRSNGPTLHL